MIFVVFFLVDAVLIFFVFDIKKLAASDEKDKIFFVLDNINFCLTWLM